MSPRLLCSLAIAFVAISGVPARAQIYPQEMNSYSNSRESGIDPLTQYSFGGTRFDSTLDFLQRKAEGERRQRELQERQRRLRENLITNVPEQLLDSRRPDAASTRR
jgi:hypothetical protein